jgi:hypothetical protein
MAKDLIRIGATADDGTGDTLRSAGIRINNNFTEVYAQPHLELSHIDFDGNVILGTQSNANIELYASGTGTVTIENLTIDSTINLTDNEIKINNSNADMVLSANGTGSVIFEKIDLDGGTIDNTVIGGTTAVAGSFTALNVNTSASIDGITMADNTITTTTNADLELSGNGTGTVSFNGIKFPVTDGGLNQVLKTDGNGQLSYFTSPILFDASMLDDGTATLTGNSSTQPIDSFSASTYRSAKYHLQISDATADRYRLIEANVTHNGSTAYVSVFAGVDNGDGDGSTVYDSLDLSADISGGNIRLLGTVNNTNTQVIKFVRRPIKV